MLHKACTFVTTMYQYPYSYGSVYRLSMLLAVDIFVLTD